MPSHRQWSLPRIPFVKITLLKPNRNRQVLFEPPELKTTSQVLRRISVPIRSSASKSAVNRQNSDDTQQNHLFGSSSSRYIHTGTLLFVVPPKSLTGIEQYLPLTYVALPITVAPHLLPFHSFSPCLISGPTQTLAAAGLGNRDPSPLHSPPTFSLPHNHPISSLTFGRPHQFLHNQH